MVPPNMGPGNAPPLMRQERRHVWLYGGLLALLWVAMQSSLLGLSGISEGGDTPRYLKAAESILSGVLPRGKALSYLGYDFFVTPFVWLGLEIRAVAIAQILLSGLAVFVMYRLGEQLYDYRVGFTAALLYIIYPDIHYWNLIIYSDSLFTSMVVISVYLVICRFQGWSMALAIIAVVFACLIRPNGVALALAVWVYLFYYLLANERYMALGMVAVVSALAFPVLFDIAGKMLSHEQVLRHYASGVVIWGYEANALTPDTPISSQGYSHPTTNPLLAVALFAMEHPGYFAKLAGAKLFYFFGHVRPYFSNWHNLLALVVLIPVYGLGVLGIFNSSHSHRHAVVLLVAFCFFQAMIIALTFADWDGRHLIPILPIVFLFAAHGAWTVYDVFSRRPSPV